MKHVRWHVLDSFATLLKGNGEDVKTVQESLRQADTKISLDMYSEGLMPVKEPRSKRYLRRSFLKCSLAAVVATAGA